MAGAIQVRDSLRNVAGVWFGVAARLAAGTRDGFLLRDNLSSIHGHPP